MLPPWLIEKSRRKERGEAREGIPLRAPEPYPPPHSPEKKDVEKPSNRGSEEIDFTI